MKTGTHLTAQERLVERQIPSLVEYRVVKVFMILICKH